MKLPRRICVVCAKEVAVRRNGTLREHTNPNTGEKCAGSGLNAAGGRRGNSSH